MLKPSLVALGLLLGSYAHAADIQLMGSETRKIKVAAPVTLKAFVKAASPTQSHTISLMALKLSSSAQAQLLSRVYEPASQQGMPNYSLPASKQLGMSGVPVLDQGAHGACVTFATTAAIDAAVYGADTISQTCSLALGSYFSKVSLNPSGWDGSFGHYVLSQLDAFGFVSKKTEAQSGCGGLKAYPLGTELEPDTQMTPEEYHGLIDLKAAKAFSWFPILHVEEAFRLSYDAEAILNKAKVALNSGDRLTIGTLLVAPDKGAAGAVGQYHKNNDTWILTPELLEEMQNTSDFAGHEMVVTGYDDQAVAKDAEGHEHKGLVTLRNSWGRNAGDRGDFYMSYDYFKALVIEVHRIHGQSNESQSKT